MARRMTVFSRRRKNLVEGTLRRMLEDGRLSAADRNKVLAILSHTKGMRDLCQEIDGLADRSASRELILAVDGIEEPKKREFPLLKWLWEHREEILGFIIKIVKLLIGAISVLSTKKAAKPRAAGLLRRRKKARGRRGCPGGNC